MQRPFMDSVEMRPPRHVSRLWRLFKALVLSWVSDPLVNRRELRVEEGSFAGRICRTALYRMALLPPLAILLASTQVYLRTHPPSSPLTIDPMSVGVYFQSITLTTEDHVHLGGWLAPALDARQVLSEGDQAMRERAPAVVLIHGFGMSRQQMLPLFQPLHERGFVVLAVSLRGEGSGTVVGQTFGLNEALDVKAAVDLLHRKSFVDDNRIAIVGVGSGANAALLAADRDPDLAALVLDAPAQTGDEAMTAHLGAQAPLLGWLTPLCKWTFAIGYGLDTRDLDVVQYGHVLASRPSLLMRWSADAEGDLPQQRVDQIVDFLDSSMSHQAQARAE